MDKNNQENLRIGTGKVVARLMSFAQITCHTTRTNSSKITTFSGYPSLTPSCAGLLKLRESGLGLLKSTFNAEK